MLSDVVLLSLILVFLLSVVTFDSDVDWLMFVLLFVLLFVFVLLDVLVDVLVLFVVLVLVTF